MKQILEIKLFVIEVFIVIEETLYLLVISKKKRSDFSQRNMAILQYKEIFLVYAVLFILHAFAKLMAYSDF